MKIDIIMLSDLKMHSGGRETWLYNFTEEIIKTTSHNIDIYAVSDGHTNVNDLDVYDLVIPKSKIPRSLSFIYFFSKKYRKKKFDSDIVIGVGSLIEAIAILLSYSRGKYKGKRVIWLRNILSKEKGRALNRITRYILIRLEKVILSKFDLVITNGPDTAKFYNSLGLKSTTINNAINLSNWPQTEKFLKEKIKICYVGRLSRVKGIYDFLNSIERLNSLGLSDNFEFHIIGSGDENIVTLVREYSKKKLLEYHGVMDNNKVSEFLKEMDCCVALTYISNDFGGAGVSNALLEQMSSGTVLIVWNNEIFKQVLDQESAEFVEQGNVNSLTNAYIHVYNHQDLAKKKISNALRIVEGYGMEHHVVKFSNSIGTLKDL